MAIQNHIDDLAAQIVRLQSEKTRLESKRDGQAAAYAGMTAETQQMAKALHDERCESPDHAYCAGLSGDIENVNWADEEAQEWLRLVVMGLSIYSQVMGG